MNPPSGSEDPAIPPPDAGGQPAYTLEIVARIAGVSSQAIIHYQEHGLIAPAGQEGFDDETVHTLRRIEHLRETSGANLTGLKLILDLAAEVEHLKAVLRARR